MKNLPIFDAHLHILLKSILTGYQMNLNNKGTSPWEKLKTGIAGVFLGKTLKSQSNLNQIKEASATLVVHALFSPDYSLIDAGLVDKIGIYIIKPLKKEAIQKLKYNAPTANITFEIACIEYVKNNVPNKQLPINCLTQTTGYDEQKINLVFNLEGGHNLYNQSQNVAADLAAPATGIQNQSEEMIKLLIENNANQTDV